MQNTAVKKIYNALGGKEVIKENIQNWYDLEELSLHEISSEAIGYTSEYLRISKEEIIDVISTSERTGQRIKKKERNLKSVELDRLIRLIRVANEAVRVFGNKEKAVKWLLSSIRAFGDRKPLDLFRSDIGTKLVEETLIRIEHGVHS